MDIISRDILIIRRCHVNILLCDCDFQRALSNQMLRFDVDVLMGRVLAQEMTLKYKYLICRVLINIDIRGVADPDPHEF